MEFMMGAQPGNWHFGIDVFFILAGAGILIACLLKVRPLSAAVPLIPESNRSFIARALLVNRFLIIFFFIGYLIVAYAFARQLEMIGNIFVGFVFFCGAVFVFLEIAIDTRIINEIQRTLHGLLPICMSCKRIREPGADPADQQSWSQIESYISDHSRTLFSHGLCPECLARARRKR